MKKILSLTGAKELTKKEQQNINGGQAVAIVVCGNGDEFCYPNGLTQTQIVAICNGHGGYVRQRWQKDFEAAQ